MDEIEEFLEDLQRDMACPETCFTKHGAKSHLKRLIELVENEQAILCADSQMEWYPNINNRSTRVSEQIDWEEL